MCVIVILYDSENFYSLGAHGLLHIVRQYEGRMHSIQYTYIEIVTLSAVIAHT